MGMKRGVRRVIGVLGVTGVLFLLSIAYGGAAAAALILSKSSISSLPLISCNRSRLLSKGIGTGTSTMTMTAAAAYSIEECDFTATDVSHSILLTSNQLPVSQLSRQKGLTGRKPLSQIPITAIPQSLYTKGLALIREVFLPAGFPHTVPPEYMTFQIWNIIQDFCSYLRGIMSTKAVLEGLGVGRADITSTQAVVQWIFRDGASMIGGLLFTAFSSQNFGQNAKAWRLFADYINNVGITLEMLAPLKQKYFLSMICTASICKALCGIAAGATGSVIAEHWGSLHGNIAEVNSKNGAQHTAVSLIGLALSMHFARFAAGSPYLVWGVYLALTALHMYSNYMAMRVLALRSINIVRYDALLATFFASEEVQDWLQNFCQRQKQQQQRQQQQQQHQGLNEREQVENDLLTKLTDFAQSSPLLSIETIARIEPILSLANPFATHRQLYSRIRKSLCSSSGHSRTRTSSGSGLMNSSTKLWKSVSEVVSHCGDASAGVLRSAAQFYDRDNFMIFVLKKHKNRTVEDIGSMHLTMKETYSRDTEINIGSDEHRDIKKESFGVEVDCFISFRSGCTAVDQARGIFEAQAWKLTGSRASARHFTEALFPIFWISLEQQGWQTKRVYLQPRGARFYKVSGGGE